MSATAYQTKLEKDFIRILNSLSPKEKSVILMRIGHKGERKTLQSIGNSFKPNITRERVRQIEDAGIKKIGRIIKTNHLRYIQEKAFSILKSHSGVLVRDKLLNALIKELELPTEINSYMLEFIVQSDLDITRSKPRLGTQTYFHIDPIQKKDIELIFKTALSILKKRKDVMEQKELYALVREEIGQEGKNYELPMIDSVMDIFDEIVKGEGVLIGLSRWKILNPKTLKDKTIYVMKKEKVPMHFVDISNKITEHLGENVKVTTIHNELIRNDEFILIGRGIYALKEWGFKTGTVMDVIKDILKKSSGPMSTEEIVKRVLKIRNVKNATIYMNLQNKKEIKRVGRNYYDLQDNK